MHLFTELFRKDFSSLFSIKSSFFVCKQLQFILNRRQGNYGGNFEDHLSSVSLALIAFTIKELRSRCVSACPLLLWRLLCILVTVSYLKASVFCPTYLHFHVLLNSCQAIFLVGTTIKIPTLCDILCGKMQE